MEILRHLKRDLLTVELFICRGIVEIHPIRFDEQKRPNP